MTQSLLSDEQAKAAGKHYCLLMGLDPEKTAYVDEDSHAPLWWIYAKEIKKADAIQQSIAYARNQGN